MPGTEAGNPQQREKTRQRLVMRALGRALGQHQQIDIGAGKQLATAVASRRQQMHVRRRAVRPLPSAAHQRIDTGSACRSEEHTSELQSLMRISYAVFCLKKKKTTTIYNITYETHT